MKAWTPKQIRELRESLGLNKVEFAKFLGITPVYASYIEKKGGAKKPGRMMKQFLDYIEKHERGD